MADIGVGRTYNSTDGLVLLFGGTKAPSHQEADELLADLWVFSLSSHTWHQVQPDGDAPTPRQGAAMVVHGTQASAFACCLGFIRS
jgi:hypothetical protein